MNVSDAFNAIPASLRDKLLSEYKSITQNFYEHRWSPSELSGGRFCEIVFTILDGFAKSAYAPVPEAIKDFPSKCRSLESHAHVPRSFRILIPRTLPALYEVRNNRGVGHASGDINPNIMDATFVMSVCSWVMAEMVRCFHNLPIKDAQALVNGLAERRTPIVWEGENTKRVLDTSLTLSDQILFLTGTSALPTKFEDLLLWADCTNKTYFKRLLNELHSKRMIEFDSSFNTVLLLPPGAKRISDISSTKQ